MSEELIAERLHELERKVLLALKNKDSQTSEELVKTASIDESSVNRALLWLSSKKLITVKEVVKELITLDVNGKEYVKTGLPEKRFIKLALSGAETLSAMRSELSKDEFNISIGLLKKNNFIKIDKGKIIVTKEGVKWYNSITPEEEVINSLTKSSLELRNLDERVIKGLLMRKRVVKTELKTIRTAKLTSEGKSILKYVKIEKLIGQLTPEMLLNNTWKGKKFRQYDLTAPSPRVFRGKKGLLSYMKSKIRQIFLDMGFTEMKGDFLESSFWNFDALYQPQGHPAREMHDTFFVKNPYKSNLPSPELVKKVAQTHENGWTTGSRGWGYEWDSEIAATNVLRTHTTGVSVKTIARLTKNDLPAKFFSLDKVFRNETLDYKHLFQFHQVEGIIVDPKATFKDLLGMLKLFFKRLGFEKVRFRPGYFPYTEMSVEPEVLHPIKKEWMELGGAGIFRPEVVKPLIGFEVPVLAWGLGFERLVLDMYNLNDVRNIYPDDINKLRNQSGFTRRL